MGTFEEILENNIRYIKEFREKGINPYGKRFERSHSLKELVDNYEEGLKVKTAGRIYAVRDHGKTKFMDLRDFSGKIQLYLKKGIIPDEDFEILKKIGVGDFIGVEGELLKTRTGEITIKVESFILLSKAIRPLPEKWHGLKDVEARYRQRYVDLIANEDSREVFIKRTKIIKAIRSFLDERGFLEVETPMMQAVPGGALARPFKTHHNALNIDLYLRVAPELFLKRLLVGGFEKVYELNRNFRNEGLSTKHNPEFTMLEIYSAYDDYKVMMDLCESIIKYAAEKAETEMPVKFNGKEINIMGEWKKISYMDALKKYSGVDNKSSLEDIRKKAKSLNIENAENMGMYELLNEIFEAEIEWRLIEPTFVYDYPKELCPLAKTKEDNPEITERFELIIAGNEIANAYSELNDPIDQKERFERQVASIDKEKYGEKSVDYDYVRALEYGMPPAGGLGIGIDRLVMLLTSRDSIKDVILFPQLKPEQKT